MSEAAHKKRRKAVFQSSRFLWDDNRRSPDQSGQRLQNMLDKKKRIRTEFKTKTLSVEVFFGKQQSFFSAYSSGCACSEIDGARHS